MLDSSLAGSPASGWTPSSLALIHSAEPLGNRGRKVARVVYRFDNYSLDPELRELRFGSELVTVEPKVFDLLHYLIRNRDRVVSKDDMLSAVWSGRIVSESALTSRLTAVRHAV